MKVRTPACRRKTFFRVWTGFRRLFCAVLSVAPYALPSSGQATLVLNGGSTIATVAGVGRDGRFSAGPAASVTLGFPRGVAYDAAGKLYVADSRNHQVYAVAADGSMSVLAGTGEQGFSGDGGPATAARLNSPSALLVRTDGSVVFCDTSNHRVRSINSAGIITTIAGTGSAGNGGDGAPAAAAMLRRPAGLAVDASGNLFIADTGNHRVRRIGTDGNITAFAGTGEEGDGGDGGAATAATFLSPSALLVLQDGSILVGDSSARRVRSIHLDGTVAAYGQPASFRRPEGMTQSPAGGVLLSDAGLQQLLQLSPNSAAPAAGNGAQGPLISGAGQASPLDSPSGMASASDGSISIADRRNHQVQRLTLPLLDFGSIPAGQRSPSKQLTLQNGGTPSLRVTAITLPAGFIADTSGTCTTLPLTLTAGQQCTVDLVFQPQTQGVADATAIVTTDVTPAAALRLMGTALPPATQASSQTALTSNGTVAYAGAAVQLTAVVMGGLSNIPAGNVTFSDGATPLTTASLASGSATYSTSALAPGTHALKAAYSGDARYAPSSSSAVALTVVIPPDFTFSSSAPTYSAKLGGTVSVPLTCLPQNGTLNHAVTFSITGLPAGFTAVFAPQLITLASNPVTAALTITVPATLALATCPRPIYVAAMLFLVPLGWTPRRRAASALLATSAALAGCGGGFRTVATTATPGPRSYNLSVTATTTGVLGDPLVHTIPVEVVITQ